MTKADYYSLSNNVITKLIQDIRLDINNESWYYINMNLGIVLYIEILIILIFIFFEIVVLNIMTD